MIEANFLPASDWMAMVADRMKLSGRSRFGNGVSTGRFEHEELELDELPGCRDVLFGYRLSGVARAERKLEGRWDRATTRRGSITIVPAGQPTSWRLAGSGSLLHVYVPTALIGRVFEADDTVPAGDLVEHLGAEDPMVGSLVEGFDRETNGAEIGSSLYAEALLTQIVVTLVRRHSSLATSLGREGVAFRESVRHALVDYIEAHLGHDISLVELARLAGLGLSQFNRNFRATLGLPPYRYVLARRIARAKDLLTGSKVPISEIAAATGFAHQAHLTTTFKRFSGHTPAAFRAGRWP